MKKNVLIFGSIAGMVVVLVMLLATTLCYQNFDFEYGMVIGYSSMIIAFAFIFVSIKSYRDKQNNGQITFGRAFLMGLYISLIASTMYVIAWLIYYYNFVPDFMDKYVDHIVTKTKASGAPAAELQATIAQLNEQKELYKKPLYVILMTYMEIFPVGLLFTIIAALVLKRRKPQAVVA